MESSGRPGLSNHHLTRHECRGFRSWVLILCLIGSISWADATVLGGDRGGLTSSNPSAWRRPCWDGKRFRRSIRPSISALLTLVAPALPNPLDWNQMATRPTYPYGGVWLKIAGWAEQLLPSAGQQLRGNRGGSVIGAAPLPRRPAICLN